MSNRWDNGNGNGETKWGQLIMIFIAVAILIWGLAQGGNGE